ncbi:GIY-YIG nuclease family protein [Azospirillum brasilense]|uniref:GIY-YIG nuclease family protein n=1 Tax=Azospirillum brasilense TaxID=192 RepID=UPI0010C0F564|nr:GIY-YIG nuclease family protein [Azospirillum brasilense]
MQDMHKVEAVVAEWPSGLKNAAEVAPQFGLTADKLIAFADAGYAPHWRIDGGPPLFRSSEVKPWVAQNLLQKEGGKDLPFSMRIVFVPDKPTHSAVVPVSIQNIENLREISEVWRICPGVYFLCKNGEVVYVGQSVSPASRIASHDKNKDFDQVYFLPCPEFELNRVEAAFIRYLRPRLNGQNASGTMIAPASNGSDAEVLARYGITEEGSASKSGGAQP